MISHLLRYCRIVIILFVLTWLLPGCGTKHGADASGSETTRRSIIVGDPVVTSFSGKKIWLDTMPVPLKVAIDEPVEIPLRKNQFTSLAQPADFMFGEPRRLTPGKGGTAAPELVQISSKTVVAIPSPSRPIRQAMVKPDATHDIRYWGMEQGLPSYYFHALYEDPRGYLWLGGWGGGLSRFDGVSLIDYRNPDNELPEDGVNNINQAADSSLWISMRNQLVHFDGSQFRIFHDQSLLGDGVRSTLTDLQGRIWVVTEGHGLLRYEGGEDFLHFGKAQGLPSEFIFGLDEDADGNLWLTTGEALVKFDGTDFYLIETTETTENLPLIADADQGVWVGTTGGLIHYTEQDATSYPFPTENGRIDMVQLKLDTTGRIWAGTHNYGLFSFREGEITNYSRKEGLSSNSVSSIMADSRGRIWVGTHGAGLNRLDPGSFTYLLPDLPDETLTINGTCKDRNGTRWLSTDSHGLLSYDGTRLLQYGTRRRLWWYGMLNIIEDREGNIWHGLDGYKSLTRWDGETITTYTEEQGIAAGACNAMALDKEGRLWLAMMEGLSIIDGDTVTSFNLEDDPRMHNVDGLAVGDNGEMWLSSAYGIGVAREDSLYWYGKNEGVPSTGFYNQAYHEKSGLWMAGYEGLFRFDGTRFYTYDKEQGLEDPRVFDVGTDTSGNAWASADFGLYRVSADTSGEFGETPRIEAFHYLDGLRSETQRTEGLSITPENELWLSNSYGICQLEIDGIDRSRSITPSVYLNALTINESALTFTEDTILVLGGKLDPWGIRHGDIPFFTDQPTTISVPYLANHFTFNFIAFDWAAPHKIHYQYRLLGAETEWSAPGNENIMDYRGLRHGTYTFEARAASRDGLWGIPLSYTFTIRPPWWLSWWAKFLYGLATIALLYLAFVLIRRRFYLRAALAQKQTEANRLKELDTFKSRLFTNLTHEFRTPLTVILGMTRQLRGNPEEALLASRLIERNGESMLRLVNQLLDLSKLENNAFKLNLKQGDIIPFLRFLTHSFSSYAEEANITLQFSAVQDHLVMDFDEEQVQQILSNLISNAVKFTPTQGAVAVKVFRSENDLKIEVSDTGIGIAHEEQDNIFNRFYQVDGTTTRKGEGTGIGLAHTQELVHLMEGSISLESKLGHGSVFTVALPIHTDALAAEIDFTAANRPAWLPISREKSTSTLHQAPVANTEEQPLLLIVEDNVDVVTYLKTCLEPAYRVAVALNGRIGVDRALELIPDIIISDVMMPEMDGLQLCNALKNDERTSHVPIILLTAKADIQSKLAGLKRGADAYLSKPFDREELLIRLDRLMERQRRMAAYFSDSNSAEDVDPALVPEEILIEDAFVRKLRGLVEEHYQDEQFSLPQLCELVNMSRSQLFRKLKALANISPSAFIRNHRLDAAKRLLQMGDLTIAEVAYAVGFKEPAHFTKVFRDAVGETPSFYAAEARRE